MSQTKHRVRTRKVDVQSTRTRRGGRERQQVTIFGNKEEEHVDNRVKAIKDYQNRQVVDPFSSEYSAGSSVEFHPLQPPFDYGVLLSLPNENSTLKQCIEAMAINIEGFGYRLEYVGDETKMESEEAKNEKSRLTALLARPNSDYGLDELRKRCRYDKETLGAGYIEVMRDAKGRIAAYSHIPANHMRKTTKDKELVLVDSVFNREGETVRVKHRKQFRRYVQKVGTRTVYFKEFGDPRIIDYKTGKETSDVSDAATEIIEMAMYSAGHAYGLPRWINQLPAVIGSRECEINNLAFFKDNAIPAMAVLVSGGALTENSTKDINDAFTAKKGLESMNRVLVIEALGDEEAADNEGRIPPPKLDIKPLAGERQNDATFNGYDEANHIKIRSSFRLPPLFLGRADDYSRATAEASLVVAEAQVFNPERTAVDDVYNNKILVDENGEPPKYWRMRTNPAKMSGSEATLEALEVLDNLGALTPNIAIGMANELFNLDIEVIKEEWGNMPFQMSLVKAGAKVDKRTTDAANELDKVELDNEDDKAAVKKVVKLLREFGGANVR